MTVTWNYRLVVTAESVDERDVVVCEVYYDDGIPTSYVSTAPPGGSTPKEALWAYQKMDEAFRQPVLRHGEHGLVEVSEEEERSWETPA